MIDWLFTNTVLHPASTGASCCTTVFATTYSVTSIVLGIGVSILSITLIVMMVSRWGEARPVAKCVGLSVLAHLLLMIYAYSTNMLQPIGTSTGEAVTVRMITDEHADTPEVRQWDRADSDFVPDTATNDFEPADVKENLSVPDHTPTEPIAESIPLPEEVWNDTHLPDPQDESPSVEDSLIQPDSAVDAASNNESTEPAPDAESHFADNLPPLTDVPPIAHRDPAPVEDPFEPSPSNTSPSNISDTARTLVADANTINDAEAISGDHDAMLAQAETATNARHGVPGNVRAPAVSRPPTENRRRTQASTVARSKRLPNKYEARTAERSQRALDHGGGADTEAAVEHSLKWLASVQDADGRWDASAHSAGIGLNPYETSQQNNSGVKADTAITSLALLAFMGAGHTHRNGPYKETVQYGLEFLLRSQSRNSGSLAGNATSHAQMYCHGISTLALSEAYIMTQDEKLLPFLRNAVRYTIACQNPTTGGWRYHPGEAGDTSQFGWQLMSLMSARTAGLHVPDRNIQGMHRWLERVSSGPNNGLASYKPRQMHSNAMTAEALVCRLFLVGAKDHRAIDTAASYVSRAGIGDGRLNLYYCYYATLGLYQMQDRRWESWNRELKAALLPRQRTTGSLAGSWDPNTVWGRNGGRVYTTALATLCLETYYRYLPFYDLPKDRTARMNSLRR